MSINLYTRSDCEQLLLDETFWSADTLPVSRARLVSQVRNPRSAPDDVMLLTATEEGRVIAHLGLIPDVFYPADGGEQQRFGWTTSWWQDQAAQDTSAASRLVFKAAALYDGQIGMAGVSGIAKKVLDASRRFKALKDYRMCYYLVELPNEFKGRRLPAGLINPLLRFKTRLFTGAKSGLEIDYLEHLDADMEAFLRRMMAGDSFRPDKAFFDWMFDFPWGSSVDPDDQAAVSEFKRYQFSLRESDIRQMRVRLHSDGSTVGFLWLTRREDNLILKYAYYEPELRPQVIQCLQKIAVRERAPFLVIADDALNLAMQKTMGFYLAKRYVPVHFIAGRHVEVSSEQNYQFGLPDRVFS